MSYPNMMTRQQYMNLAKMFSMGNNPYLKNYQQVNTSDRQPENAKDGELSKQEEPKQEEPKQEQQ